MLAFTAEDKPLIETIYEEKALSLRKYAYGVLKNEQDAADAVQQSALDFMEIFHTLAYISKSKLCGYLFIITRNNVYDTYNEKRKIVPLDDIFELPEQIDVEEVALRHITAQELRQDIERLPPKYASYLQLRYLEQLDRNLIARVLKVKPDSLRMIDVRAKKMLLKLQEEKVKGV